MEWIVNFLKGIAISVATMVPGVSGGTMAIILNIYDDLIHAISSFFDNWKSNVKLLLQLGLGAIAGLLLFSRVIELALNKYPVIMSFFFIGVIVGGIPVLYKKAISVDKNKYNYIYLIIGFVVALFFSGGSAVTSTMVTEGGNTNIILLVIAGVVIAVALILPGISGSFVLLMLGLYDVTLNAINNLNFKFLIPVGIGVIIGIIFITKILEMLMNKYPGKTYMMILGFVGGSIIAIYPKNIGTITIFNSVIPIIIGFIIITFISKKETLN